MTVRKATESWVGQFNHVPGSVIEKLGEIDDSVILSNSDLFRLIASPTVDCLGCGLRYEGDLSLEELEQAHADGRGVACGHCSDNDGSCWTLGLPDTFPCGWSTLFAPKDSSDIDWLRDHAEEVAKLGFYVFDSEDFGVLLGIDAGGFDFYDAYWMPLYRLRGLRWHNTE